MAGLQSFRWRETALLLHLWATLSEHCSRSHSRGDLSSEIFRFYPRGALCHCIIELKCDIVQHVLPHSKETLKKCQWIFNQAYYYYYYLNLWRTRIICHACSALMTFWIAPVTHFKLAEDENVVQNKQTVDQYGTSASSPFLYFNVHFNFKTICLFIWTYLCFLYKIGALCF